VNTDARSAFPPPSLEEWLSWPRERVARWVLSRPQPVVMGWPFNGTRRWYLLYREKDPTTNDYVAATIRSQAEQHRTVFAHGVGVIAAPHFGAELLKRGREYTRMVLGGLLRFGDDPVNREMFDAGLRLRFYGDYEEIMDTPDFRPMLEACVSLEAATASGDGPLLLIGLFADDPYPKIARLSVEFAEKHGRPPDRRELIEAYYGLPVPDLGLYLGFSQHTLFDVPLLTTGKEDLYATLAPSADLTETQLREILYDHLVTRRAPEPDYDALPDEALAAMAGYNERHRGDTLGVGRLDPCTGLWHPVLPHPDGRPDGSPHARAGATGTLLWPS
jgi:adenosine tuberculosinyltransferase